MVEKIAIVGIFCEDIREEKQGTETVVGILPDNVNVEAFPGVFPKLGIYVRAHVSIDHLPSAISLRMVHGEGAADADLTVWEESFMAKARAQSASNGAPHYGLITKAVLSGFRVEAPGRISIVARIDGEDSIIASMNVQAKPD